MPLTANRDVPSYASQELPELPVADNVHIHKGAFVGRAGETGLARPLVAGDIFVGIAYAEVDNTGPGHAAGALRVRLHQAIDIVHALAGAVATHVGSTVYASADDTLTLTPTGHSRIGRIVAYEGGDLLRVRCQPHALLGGLFENAPVVAIGDEHATLTRDHLNRTLLVSNTTARTLTLPPVATALPGAWIRVVKLTANANAVTLDGHLSETINGAATFTGVDAAHDAVVLMCTGTGWSIIGRDLS